MKNLTIYRYCIIGCLLCIHFVSQAQEALYPNQFPLGDVTITDGPFLHARNLNIEVLLQYDTDRLLAGYRREAGLPAKSKSFTNWDGLDGHVGGHYLTALAMNYASTKNAACKQRMDYMIAELLECQNANTKNQGDWAKGYVGAVPNSKAIWLSVRNNDFKAFRGAWVPWYNLHKMFAGLRDAWLFGGSEEAKKMFLQFCDWAIETTAHLSETQMQAMLDTEYGGMNETFADAYQITKNEKYLLAAKRFSHHKILHAMAEQKDNLDNMHANTQVPKAVGFQRIANVSHDEQYKKAGNFFWETVTTNRTLAFGGNSRREFFPSVASSDDFVNEVEGPETCNSYNMLKLTEHLFSSNPSGKLVDYYERTMYNHILSTQHPAHGGYVYFTPARPRHYRVYSSPNEGMWCCVGSGMENHGKYNQFIYTHTQFDLYVNLFVPSVLNWQSKGIQLTQTTAFPFEEASTFTISKGNAAFNLHIRFPGWVQPQGFKVLVNGKSVPYTVDASNYVSINRAWKKGDKIEVKLPMTTRVETLPNVPNYIAFMHGPILLSAKTGNEDLKGLTANDGRWAHIASGERLPVDKAPIIIEDDLKAIGAKLTPVKDKPLTFTMSGLKMVNQSELILEPFFGVHDSRYMMYWMALSNDKYKSYLDSLSKAEKAKLDLQKRTIDFVAPGEQQPEADHFIKSEKSSTGNHLNEFWRDAKDGGYFSYQLATNEATELTLLVRYWGAEWGSRKFTIFIDDAALITEDNTGKWNQSKFHEVAYPIPPAMLQGKSKIRVKFQALPGSSAGAVYYIRLVSKV